MRRAALDAQYAGRQREVIQQTRGPMESFLASLPNSTAKVQEEMERLKVQGIMGAIDALQALSGGFDNFRQVAIRAIQAVIAEFIRLQLLRGAAMLFGGGAGAGGTVTGAAAAAATWGAPGWSHGGGGRILGNFGTDRNVLSINDVPIARVSRGEKLEVSNDNDAGDGRRGMSIYAPITIASGVAEPRRTGMQIGAGLRDTIRRAAERGA